VRAKREIAVFRFKLPKSGMRSLKLSMSNRPRRVRPMNFVKVTQPPHPEHNKAWCCTKSPAAITKLSHGRQRFAAEHLVENRFETFGTMKPEKTQDAYGHCHSRLSDKPLPI